MLSFQHVTKSLQTFKNVVNNFLIVKVRTTSPSLHWYKTTKSPWSKRWPHATRDVIWCDPQTGVVYGREAIGAIAPLKPTKVALFTMILYNSENSICDISPFAVDCFVTVVLWSMFHVSYSSEPVLRLDKYYWNRPHQPFFLDPPVPAERLFNILIPSVLFAYIASILG